jgi:hypothetical protein
MKQHCQDCSAARVIRNYKGSVTIRHGMAVTLCAWFKQQAKGHCPFNRGAAAGPSSMMTGAAAASSSCNALA